MFVLWFLIILLLVNMQIYWVIKKYWNMEFKQYLDSTKAYQLGSILLFFSTKTYKSNELSFLEFLITYCSDEVHSILGIHFINLYFQIMSFVVFFLSFILCFMFLFPMHHSNLSYYHRWDSTGFLLKEEWENTNYRFARKYRTKVYSRYTFRYYFYLRKILGFSFASLQINFLKKNYFLFHFMGDLFFYCILQILQLIKQFCFYFIFNYFNLFTFTLFYPRYFIFYFFKNKYFNLCYFFGSVILHLYFFLIYAIYLILSYCFKLVPSYLNYVQNKLNNHDFLKWSSNINIILFLTSFETIIFLIPMFVMFYLIGSSISWIYILESVSVKNIIQEWANSGSNCYILIHVEASQWKWTYTYLNNQDLQRFDNMTAFISTESFMLNDDLLSKGQLRLLTADKPLVLLRDQWTHFYLTSSDVIHSFSLPNFFIKVDAIPGRMHSFWIKSHVAGTFYGQCSEICGINHAFMPITVVIL